MNLELLLQQKAVEALTQLYGQAPPVEQVQVQATRKEFEGDFTLVVFPFLKISKKKPEPTANELGEWLTAEVEEIAAFNVIKGFLNLSLSETFWNNFLKDAIAQDQFGFTPFSGRTVMLEYSSPNTNKPLHLGHVRNNLLGYSVARILEANGNKVVKANLVNDRGIHICKSMLAWQKFGEGVTPESSGTKGDHLVGEFYVRFDIEIHKEAAGQMETLWPAYLQNRGTTAFDGLALDDKAKAKLHEALSEHDADGNRTIIVEDEHGNKKEVQQHFTNNRAVTGPLTPFQPLLAEAQEMLRQWEAKDPEVRQLWETMNGWVYDGFDVTYKRLGVSFDQYYYESETYLLGKEMVERGLKDGTFYQKEDGSVWCSLEAEKLTDKLLLRSDGTSVYMTQDVGTAIERFKVYTDLKQLIYTVGNEQDHHFKVLFTILKKLGFDWADECRHLSYGMVNLPEGRGKIKSREGERVDADPLMDEVIGKAKEETTQHERFNEIPEADRENLFRILGMGALKYFILKVDPKRKMVYDPDESVALQGDTGPFIQYSFARTQALKRRAGDDLDAVVPERESLHSAEKALLRMLFQYPNAIREAGQDMNPAVIAAYAMDLVKEYNRFYRDVRIFHESVSTEEYTWRMHLSNFTGEVIRSSMGLLGVEVPDRM